MTGEMMKELEELRQYKKETVYRLTDEDIAILLENRFAPLEIEVADIERIRDKAKYKFEMEWEQQLETFIEVRFSDIIEKYVALQEEYV